MSILDTLHISLFHFPQKDFDSREEQTVGAAMHVTSSGSSRESVIGARSYGWTGFRLYSLVSTSHFFFLGSRWVGNVQVRRTRFDDKFAFWVRCVA